MNDLLSRRKLATELRKSGKSYAEISQNLGTPKSTLSTWFSKEEWSVEVKGKVNANRLYNISTSLQAANMARTHKIARVHKQIHEDAIKEFADLRQNPLFMFGLALYWGEGDKTSNGRVAVINTDPELLVIISRFYRECLRVPDSSLRIGLFVYEDLDLVATKKYWSDKLDIPLTQFIKVQVLKSRSTLTKRTSKYGVCSLYFSSTELSIKIHEWIKLAAIVQW